MSATSYVTLAALKEQLSISASTTTHDTRLAVVIEAVSREIDDYCGFPKRHFFRTADEITRRFTANDRARLWIPDLVSLTALVTDADGDGTYEETWTVDVDAYAWPYDADEEQRPFTLLEASGRNGRVFPAGVRRGVKVTGMWGWPMVPEVVSQAALLQSARLAKRYEAPFGIANIPALEAGAIQLRARLDPDVELMLHGVRRTKIEE